MVYSWCSKGKIGSLDKHLLQFANVAEELSKPLKQLSFEFSPNKDQPLCDSPYFSSARSKLSWDNSASKESARQVTCCHVSYAVGVLAPGSEQQKFPFGLDSGTQPRAAVDLMVKIDVA